MNNEASTLKNIIQSRRSIFARNYVQKPIEDHLIEEIIESAIYAPTHKRTEPWRFIAFKDEGKTKLGTELARVYKENTNEETFLEKKYLSISENAQRAGCMIAIIAVLHPDKLPEWEEVAAIGCAVQNMALTTEVNGLGGYWSSPWIVNHLSEFLSLQANERCLGFFYLGYHEEPQRKAIRTPIENKLSWVKS